VPQTGIVGGVDAILYGEAGDGEGGWVL